MSVSFAIGVVAGSTSGAALCESCRRLAKSLAVAMTGAILATMMRILIGDWLLI